MAEAMLGAPFEIHGGGNDLIFPHHENEAAQTLAGRGHAARADLDAQRDAPDGRREDGQVGRQHRARSRDVLDEARAATRCSGSSRRPLPPAAGVHREALADAARRRRADPRRRAPARRRAIRRRRWRRTATRSSTRWPTTTTRRARWRRWPSGCARPTAADGPVGDSHLREMLGVLGLENLLEPTTAAPAEVVALAERREAARERRATSPRPTACATSCARAAGRSATAPAAPS